MMADLTNVILRYGQDNGDSRDFPVDKEDILIGRASECDIQLNDQQVSRFHASLRVLSDGMWLLDMDSKNGTMIDGQLIPPNRRISLRLDQSFRIGGYTFNAIIPRPGGSDATVVQLDVERAYMYDLEALRTTEFPQMQERTHLNNAACAPSPVRTVNKMLQVLREKIATSQWLSGTYPLELFGAFVSAAASFINAESPQEVIYTEGCSVGLNLIAQSLILKPGDNIVFCDLEYPANVYPWMSRQRNGVEIRQVPSICGGLTLDGLRAVVDENTRVVAASAIQFFSGHRTDLAAIGKFCRERNIIFVVDAIQAIGHMLIDVRRMNIDVLVTGGHKSIMTAPGTGFMYVREAVCETLEPRAVGALSTKNWTHYLNYDMSPQPGAGRFLIGTPNVVGMAGMIESMTLLNDLTRDAIDRHTTRLAARTLQMAQERGYELTTTLGEHGPIATFRSKLSKDETEAAIRKLEQDQGISLARQLDRQGNAHLRLSFHCYNTEEDIGQAFDALDKVHEKN